ncbi:MAG: hypothetical protein ACK5KO_12580 [Arachnia sp.]
MTDSRDQWVHQGTPRDDSWDADQSDYGTEIGSEWDDHASDQSVPVVPPRRIEPEPTPAEYLVPTGEAAPVTPDTSQPDHAPWFADQEPARQAADTDADPFARPAEPAAAAPEAEPAYAPEPEPGYALEPEPAVVDDETHQLDLGEPTRAVPSVPEAPAAPPEDVFRAAASPSQSLPTPGEIEDEERIAAQLQAEQRARNQRLGVVATSSDNELRDTVAAPKPITDKFLGSFGLMVLRLVSAAIVGIIGYQILTPIDAAAGVLSRTIIPEPRTVAWIVGFTLGAIALLLALGLLVRVAGFVMMVVGICSLAFVRWGSFSPFVEGQVGFLGDLDLLLTAVGLLLVCLGGGAWGIDGAFRRSRARAKADSEG